MSTFNKVIDLLKEMDEGFTGSVTQNDKIKDHLDSLALMNLLLSIEEKMGVEVLSDEILDLGTFGELANRIDSVKS